MSFTSENFCTGSSTVESVCTDTSSNDIRFSEISHQILNIVFDYALNKFDDTKDRLELGKPKFLSVIDNFVSINARIDMCLPAFPFKSANKVYKVFGILPDKAEEIALDRLNTMCTRIGEIYQPGAHCTIISDGLVYNDLLSISDRDTWAYGQALRAMAVAKNFHNIGFSRIRDFVDFPLPEKLEEITYVANATNFRCFLFNKFGKEHLDIDHEIATNPDTKLTYLGYRRFLESDLKYLYPLGSDRSNHKYKRDVKYLAKQMLIRGYAFAGAVKKAFPQHLRLSIHQSTGEHKISMSLLDSKTGFTTPWHCSVALLATGDWISAPMGDFQQNARLEIVFEDGRPSYFKEVGTADGGGGQDARLCAGLNGLLTPATTPELDGENKKHIKNGETKDNGQEDVRDEKGPRALNKGSDLNIQQLPKASDIPEIRLGDNTLLDPTAEDFDINDWLQTVVKITAKYLRKQNKNGVKQLQQA